jgi:DNA-binding CsgD family transcriptional regulator
MTQRKNRADCPEFPTWVDDNGRQPEAFDTGRSSQERTLAVNEVGSAIAHQLNGPLTALRLYVGEIRQNSHRLRDATEPQDSMLQMVEGAFRETERICAIVTLIADSFEGPLPPETATALSRDVINWWSRSSGTQGRGNANRRGYAAAASLHSVLALLTPREREVLGYVSEGCSNKQGAALMQIGPRTFESHRARLMRKLGARNTADLVRMTLSDNSVTP